MINREELPSPEQDRKENFSESVNKILEKEHFFITPEAKEIIQEQIESGNRFICVVGTRKEKDAEVERFLKIPIQESAEIDESFKRQVLFGKFLKENGKIKTRNIIAENLNRQEGLPYAIMETFKSDEAKIGFITKRARDMELLTTKEAQSCVNTIEQLHSIDIETVPVKVREVLRHFDGSAEEFCDSILQNLDQKVRALDTEGEEEYYHEVLNRRLGVADFRKKVEKLVNVLKDSIKKEGEEEILVHGDLAPNNLYVYDNGEVEFLDLEWSGTCNNEAIAMITDFGNLRARAWNNKEFRETLDVSVIEKYKKKGKEDIGKAVVAFGILHSHIALAGFFENYPLDKQRREEEKGRRESTESDIKRAWEITGITF